MEISRESLTRILNFLPYPFLIAVTEDNVVYPKFSNKKFDEEIGYTLNEISTLDDWFLKAYPNLNYRAEIKAKWMAKVDEAIREGRDYVMERARITTKKNGQQWYEVKSSFAGNIQFVAFVNIHDTIEKEEILERLNENKNKILSILGHDVKAPVQNLTKLVEMLIDGGLSQKEFQNNLITVQRLSSETLQFIDTTLTWTRNNFEDHKPVLQHFLLNEVIINVVGFYTREFEIKKISPRINIPSTTTIFCDREVIHIALRNILSNALKFSPPEAPILISYHHNDNTDYITVTDEGVGIPPDIIDRILKNKSNKASSSGFGIGLRLCKELLYRIGGKLEIKSKEGKGTSISIMIPSVVN